MTAHTLGSGPLSLEVISILNDLLNFELHYQVFLYVYMYFLFLLVDLTLMYLSKNNLVLCNNKLWVFSENGADEVVFCIFV